MNQEMSGIAQKITFTLSVVLFLSCRLHAHEDLRPGQGPLAFEACYTGDNINNILGGIKTGSVYLGMANLMVDLDFEQAGLWKGGRFFVNAANTHGATPSSDLLGDIQVISNIEAGDHTYVQELWFQQQLGKVEFTAGLQDLNVEFANSEHGALYLNSSFGILPIISNNFNASIFPLTTLGFTARWNVSEKTSWINAVYDGSPTNFDYNPYNLNWQFNSGDGFLLISELQKSTNHELPGIYKLGIYSHFHIRENLPDSLINRLFGIYAYADQTLWQHEARNIGLFAQLGYSPSEQSTNNFYFGSGINCTGLFSKKGKDTAGLALAHVRFTRGGESETAVELTYQYQVTENLFFQPDGQYVIHPSGTGEALPNALALSIRFGICF